MVRAWFMDEDVESDQRLEHHRNPPEFVDLTNLFKITGVEYFKVSRKSNISGEKLRVCSLWRRRFSQRCFDKKRKCSLMHILPIQALSTFFSRYSLKFHLNGSVSASWTQSIHKEHHLCDWILLNHSCSIIIRALPSKAKPLSAFIFFDSIRDN